MFYKNVHVYLLSGGSGTDRELRRRSPAPGSATSAPSGSTPATTEDKPNTRWSQRTSSVDSHASAATTDSASNPGDPSTDTSPTASKPVPAFESLVASRPKRNIIPKNLVGICLDFNVKRDMIGLNFFVL